MIQALNFSSFAGITSIEDFRSELSKQRWRDGFVCPRCGCTKGYSLACRDATECSACGKQTSSTAETIFHGIRHLVAFTKILTDFFQGKHASAAQIAREFEIDPGTACSYLQKIRSAISPETIQSDVLKVPSTLIEPAQLEPNSEPGFQEVVAQEDDGDDISPVTILEPQGHELKAQLLSESMYSAIAFLPSVFFGISRKYAHLYVAELNWLLRKRTIDLGEVLTVCIQKNPLFRHEITEYSSPLLLRPAVAALAGSRAPPQVRLVML